MRAVTKLSLLAGAAFVAVALPVASQAADAASATVQEVIVTANKREENLRDVPQSVTALAGDDLQTQRAFAFEDYVTRVPGMNLVSSQAGRSRLSLRGINAGEWDGPVVDLERLLGHKPTTLHEFLRDRYSVEGAGPASA